MSVLTVLVPIQIIHHQIMEIHHKLKVVLKMISQQIHLKIHGKRLKHFRQHQPHHNNKIILKANHQLHRNQLILVQRHFMLTVEHLLNNKRQSKLMNVYRMVNQLFHQLLLSQNQQL